MPRTLEQNKKIKEASKKRIMEAALKVFGEYGFDGASVSQIAREAGISTGLMYNYFASKDDLVLTIVDDFLEHHFGEWGKKISDAQTPYDKLVVAVDRYVIPLQEDVNKWRLIRELSVRKEFKDEFWNIVSPIRNVYAKQLESLYLQLGEDPVKGFWGLQTFLEGVASCYCSYGEKYPIQQIRNQYLKGYRQKLYE
ncbi:Regulatory protein TetR [Croceitalea dokdonensis DOKDO 023]|uniref:Regulatory protein TetR n=1 Tax=Croceitalea dokdonensis DOKDO 023 TaxID=1300341 RepID=A0A0P7AFF8_9FLAO|nr:TetR/AcrR family transcriptional regulator [Croceitalea dokdonensis]KPM32050.1 Regulatory protein TetR [Croceitalea dokdonensis DOKDO 023]